MIRFLHSVPVGFAIMALLGCGSAPPPPIHPPIAPAPREQLARLIEQYWTDYLRLNPQRLPEGAARRFDGASGYDISAQFLADSLALERSCLGEVLELQRPRLDADSQLSYDIFKRERELAVESFTYPSELLPVNPFRSMPQLFAQTGAGAGQYAMLSAKDYEHWRARMVAYVRWTGQAIANMREGMRRGYALPRVLVEEMLPQLAALGEDSPANVFYQPLSSIPATIADSERNRLSQGITAGVRDRILPAYRTLLRFPARRVSAAGEGKRRPLGAAARGVLVRLSGQAGDRYLAHSGRNPQIRPGGGRASAWTLAIIARGGGQSAPARPVSGRIVEPLRRAQGAGRLR